MVYIPGVTDAYDWSTGQLESIAATTEGYLDEFGNWVEGTGSAPGQWVEGQAEDAAAWGSGIVSDAGDWVDTQTGALGDWATQTFTPGGGGGGGGGGANVNMVSTSAPWAEQQPYLQQMFQQAWDLPGMEAYGGPRVAGFDPAQTGALGAAEAALAGGGTTLHGARGVIDETLAGRYLDPATNPYLTGAFQRATEQYVNPVTTAAVQAGRFGSGAQAAQTGEAFARTANEIYGQNYQQERSRQMQAVGMAPQVAFAPEAAQFAIGGARQGMNQQMMNAAQQQFQEQQMAPWQTLMNRRNMTIGDFGGEGTTQGQVPVSGGK